MSSRPHVLTGFHAIEEAIRASAASGDVAGLRVLFCKEGPRARSILGEAKKAGIPCKKASAHELDGLASRLPEELRDHRGLILVAQGGALPALGAQLSLEAFAARAEKEELCAAAILDSVTDPRNAGAVLRSADQFGVGAVIIPESRAAGGKGGANAESAEASVIARTSSGAAAWVPLIRATNLVRAVERLKKAGFWVYGAEASPEAAPVHSVELADKAVFVLGSEGKGMARLLRESCDAFVSIPTQGRLDSLNVSVAAGILFYEYRRQKGCKGF